MFFKRFSFLFLVASLCVQSSAFANLTKRQMKAVQKLAKPESSYDVSVLDQVSGNHSIAIVGVDYKRVKTSDLSALAQTMHLFEEVYVQKSDLDSPIRRKIAARVPQGKVMVLGDLPGSWFQSYLYPCATLLSAMGTSAAAVLACMSPDLSQIALTTAAAALTYLNYKKWSTQERRAIARKIRLVLRILDNAPGQSLVVTDNFTAFLIKYSLIDSEKYVEVEVQPEIPPPVCLVEPIQLTPEEEEQERVRLIEEEERERIQTEKHLETLRKETEARNAREAGELERANQENYARDWEKLRKRAERETRRAKKK